MQCGKTDLETLHSFSKFVCDKSFSRILISLFNWLNLILGSSQFLLIPYGSQKWPSLKSDQEIFSLRKFCDRLCLTLTLILSGFRFNRRTTGDSISRRRSLRRDTWHDCWRDQVLAWQFISWKKYFLFVTNAQAYQCNFAEKSMWV